MNDDLLKEKLAELVKIVKSHGPLSPEVREFCKDEDDDFKDLAAALCLLFDNDEKRCMSVRDFTLL